MTHTDEQSVLATEDEYVAAEVSRDEAALRRLVDDRFVFNESAGTTSGKEATVTTQRYTWTYVKRQGQWRMLALQMQQRTTK